MFEITYDMNLYVQVFIYIRTNQLYFCAGYQVGWHSNEPAMGKWLHHGPIGSTQVSSSLTRQVRRANWYQLIVMNLFKFQEINIVYRCIQIYTVYIK